MNISNTSNSAPINGIAARAGGNAFLPLKSSGQTNGLPLPDRNAGIPLNRETGKAIPLNRERTIFQLKNTDGNRDVAAEKAKLKKAAEGFEAIFIRQLLKTMRTTVPDGNIYGSGATGEMYGDMVESSLADAMSKQGKFGIASTIYNQMVRRIDQREMSRQSLSPQVSPQVPPQDGDR